ncbi:adhesion G protein-coupled receptor L4-like isoform X2 [Dysidea avara]
MHNRDICSQRGNTQIEPSGITVETLSHIVVVLQGQQVMLECTPTPGYLPIEWKFNDAEIERDDVTFSPLDLQRTLTIDSVEYDDSGEYTCFVPGNFIAPINQTITLDVLSGAPSIIGLSASQLVAIESQLTLICNASGFPTPAVKWRINGTVYNRDFVHMQLIDKIVIETLTVDSVAWSDAGFYECVATNSLGVVVGNTTINVEDKNCPEEVDSVWGIEWQRTLSGSRSMQNCPGMSSGHAYRWCLQNATWDTFINTTLCQNTQLVELNERVNNLKTLLSNNTNQTVTEVETVSEALIMITDASMGSITPNDVNRSIEIIDVITRITHDASSKETTNDTIRSLNSTLNNVATTIDNLLSDSNRVSFQESQNSQLPTLGEDLLRSIENFAIAVGEVATTEASFNNLTNMRKAIPNDNIFVEALLPADNEEMIETIVFPDDNVVTKINGVKITIPASAIIQQRHSENAKVPVVNFITNNLQSYINDPNLSEQSSNMSSGVIISTKFSEGPINLSNEARVMLTFNNLDISENDTVTTECVFWDFNLVRENDQTRGGWSSEGIIQDDDDTLPVLCYATHLTSFSVLIKPSGNTRAIKESGLHIVSYVGCGISIVSLLLNIAAIIVLRRNSLKSKHNIVHLNLSIALLIGLILFVSGIENSTGSEGTCLVVAILLHYFFLAVFCWMLCEGIIILVMFFALFYKGIFQRLFFFMIIGWGLPIPIVAVSAGLSHKNYGIKDSDGSLTACWISEEDGAIWAFTAPLAVILLINLFILIISLVKVYHSRKQKANMSKAHMSQHNAAKTLLVSVLALLPLLGGTWILGMLFLVDSDSVVVAWIFTIVNSMQGFAIFYFHVVRNKEVKAEIQEKFTNWRKERMLRSSMKSSFMKSSAKDSTLSRQDSTVQSSGPLSRASSRYDKNKHSYVSSSKGYSSSTVAVDPIIVETDDQATLADKDVLQYSTV